MSIATVPCAPGGLARWTQITDLGGRDYLLTFRWNVRTGRWALDLATEGGDILVAGVVLASGFDVLRGVHDTRRPPGRLVLVDLQRASGVVDPTFSSLGTRHVLAYVDGEDLAA